MIFISLIGVLETFLIQLRGVNDAIVSARVLKDDKWQVTGSITMNPHLAESKELAGVMIHFNGVKYE